MNLLDEQHIERIEADVENARITLQNLAEELVDHICCEVENEMSTGKNFDEAYAIVKKQIGIQVLQEIQANTLYLTDKSYRLMKTTMKITGTISLALIAMGTVFKIFHWPGAGPLLLAGFALMCFVFFPSAIYINYRDGKTKGAEVLNISILVGGIAFMTGILFKVMHWPGASFILLIGWSLIIWVFMPALLFVKLKEAATGKEKRVYTLGVIALMIFELSSMFKMFHWPGAGPLMVVGSVMLVAIFLPMFTYTRFVGKERTTGQFIFLVLLSMYAVVMTALMAMNVSADILGRSVKEESNASKIVSYFEKKKSQYLIAASDSAHLGSASQISGISDETDKLKILIEKIKFDMVRYIDGADEAKAVTAVSDPSLIVGKDNIDIVNHYMLGPNGEGESKTLKAALDEFRKSACEATSSDHELSGNINALLNTADRFDANSEEKKSWEEASFRGNTLITTVALLTNIEKNVRMVESAAIKHIRKPACR
jgi:hypothetical protein